MASVLSLLIALAVLNASLTFENVWPTPRITWGHTISVELALALVALGVSGRWRVPLARRAIPAAWVYLVVGRLAGIERFLTEPDVSPVAAGTAEGQQGMAAWIDPASERNHAQGAGHLFVNQVDDAVGGTIHVAAKLMG